MTQEALLTEEPVWIPTQRPFTFRADPFGLWRDDRLYVFVESFDYREPIGRIEVLVYDRELNLIACELALQEPWHLSYPFVFSGEGETWLLPEARRSGALTLYRAIDFPTRWERSTRIPVPAGSVDPTAFFWRNKWWLLCGVRQGAARTELHVFHSERLGGPWQPHPRNPVRRGKESARPGGMPQVFDDFTDLPVQDCRGGYGERLRRLRITELDEEQFAASDSAWLAPDARFHPFDQGVHTLSGAGPFSLVDFNRIDGSARARVSMTWGKAFGPAR